MALITGIAIVHTTGMPVAYSSSYIGETKYLKLLKKDDISRIIIRGDKNAKRDSYRNVLPIIKWYLEGAVEGIDKMSGSTLTKAIGLE